MKVHNQKPSRGGISPAERDMNMKIKGLKKASENTTNWGINSGFHTEIWYDIITGEVWAKDVSGWDWWTEYHSKTIIQVADTTRHMSEKAIEKAINGAISEYVFLTEVNQ